MDKNPRQSLLDPNEGHNIEDHAYRECQQPYQAPIETDDAKVIDGTKVAEGAMLVDGADDDDAAGAMEAKLVNLVVKTDMKNEVSNYEEQNGDDDYYSMRQFSLFMQITAGRPSLLATKQDVQRLNRFYITQKEKNKLSKMLSRMKKDHGCNSINFEKFQQITDELNIQVCEFDDELYTNGFKINCLTRGLESFSGQDLKDQRYNENVYLMLERHDTVQNCQAYKEMDNCKKALVQAFHGLSQLLDLYSDISVLYQIYTKSGLKSAQEHHLHYIIAMSLSFTSIAATYLSNQSSMIGLKYTNGDYEPQNQRNQSFWARAFHANLFNIFGSLLILFYEILEHLDKLLRLPILLFGVKFAHKVNTFFISKKKQVTFLNDYQIQSLEEQRKVNSLMFEQLPQVLLIFSIKFQVLKCSELLEGQSDTIMNYSLASTIIQIIIVIVQSKMEARMLKESTLAYLMTKMTANNRWIPFTHLIYKLKADFNINFGLIITEIPFFSHARASYIEKKFEFGDWTLKSFLDNMIITSQQILNQRDSQRQKLVFTAECLNNVSVNMFIHFTYYLPQNHFKLELLIDWIQYYQIMKEKNQIHYELVGDVKISRSPTGVPLILLCILNEKSSTDWPLKTIMKIFLGEGNYLVKDPINGDPLTVAIKNKCFESIEILNSHNKEIFGLQQIDSSGVSSAGHLINNFITEERKFAKFKKCFEPIIKQEIKIEKPDETNEQKDEVEQDPVGSKEEENNLSQEEEAEDNDSEKQVEDYQSEDEEEYNSQEEEEEYSPYSDQMKQEKEKQQFIGLIQQVFACDMDIHKKQFINIGSKKASISGLQLTFKLLRRASHQKESQQQFYLRTALELIRITKDDKDLKLRKDEEMTLFNNAVKMLLQFTLAQYYNDYEIGSKCMISLGEFMREIRFNIFEFKNKRSQALGDLLMANWPNDLNNIDNLRRVLNYFKPADAPNNFDPVSKIFNQAIQSKSVLQLFQHGDDLIKNVLTMDAENKKILKQYKSEQFQKALIDLTKSFIDQEKIDEIEEFQPIFDEEMQRIYDDLIENKSYGNESNHNQVEGQDGRMLQFQQFCGIVNNWLSKKTIEEQDSLNEVQENQVIDAMKFTKRTKRTGNLMRAVGSQVQGGLPQQKLTSKQWAKINKFSQRSQLKSNIFGFLIRVVIEFILEIISVGDLYTDIVVLIQLYPTKHRAWTVITIFSILAPFFACLTPYLTFLREKINKDQQGRRKLQLLGYIMSSPLSIVYLIFMDLIYLFSQTVLTPILRLLYLMTCGLIDMTCFTRLIDKQFEVMFEMQTLEISGFRRMRTISQMTFETLIQFILQVRMLVYYLDTNKTELKVNYSDLILSLTLALVHSLLELTLLAMEARASKTSLLNYCIICFNGRFGWVPYSDYLVKTAEQLKQSQTEQLVDRVKLDFENITSRFLCFEIQVEYYFSDDTLIELTKTLASYPYIDNPKARPLICFGSTIDQVNCENLINLLKLCQGKIQIVLEGIDLENIFKRSKYSCLLEEEAEISEEGRSLIQELQNIEQYQLLKFLFGQNDKLWQVLKNDGQTGSKDVDLKLWDIAQDAKLLELLFQLESQSFKQQIGSIKNKTNQTVRIINNSNIDTWIVLATNSSIFSPLICSELLQQFEKNRLEDPLRYQKQMKFWHARYGPAVPKEIIQDTDQYNFEEQIHINDILKSTCHKYPQTIFIRSAEDFIEVNCQASFCFAKLRCKLVQAWDIDQNGPHVDKENSEGTQNRPLDINDLEVSLSDIKLLTMLLSDSEHEGVLNLTGAQVKRLDEAAVKLMLDTGKHKYRERTRLNDQTGNQIECVFKGKDLVGKAQGIYPSLKLTMFGIDHKENIDSNNNGCFYIQNSMEIRIPQNCQCVSFSKLKYHFYKSMKDVYIHSVIIREDFYSEHMLVKDYQEPSDKLSYQELYDRNGQKQELKALLLAESVNPGDLLIIGKSQTNYVKGIELVAQFDFPEGTDMEAEQLKLEEQCQEKFKNYQSTCHKMTTAKMKKSFE